MKFVPSYSTNQPNANLPEETNLLEFAENVCRLFARRMAEQSVLCSLDIDPGMSYCLSRGTIGDLLAELVGDALHTMPDGGQLELTAFVGPDGLEIEVADSGDSPQITLRIHGADTAPQYPGETTQIRGGLMVQTHRCPQGGLARTLRVPRAVKRAAA